MHPTYEFYDNIKNKDYVLKYKQVLNQNPSDYPLSTLLMRMDKYNTHYILD